MKLSYIIKSKISFLEHQLIHPIIEKRTKHLKIARKEHDNNEIIKIK